MTWPICQGMTNSSGGGDGDSEGLTCDLGWICLFI